MSESKHTPGPWYWRGSMHGKHVYLLSGASGRPYVMDFARWGMSGAQPRFQVREADGFGVMTDLRDLAVTDGARYPEIMGIDHPDARLIAAAPTMHALLAEADDLVPRVSESDPIAPALADWLRRVRATMTLASIAKDTP